MVDETTLPSPEGDVTEAPSVVTDEPAPVDDTPEIPVPVAVPEPEPAPAATRVKTLQERLVNRGPLA